MNIKSLQDAENCIDFIVAEKGLNLEKSGGLDLENFILFLQGQGFIVKVERIDTELERERQKSLSYLKHSFPPGDKRFFKQIDYRKFLGARGIINPEIWPLDPLAPVPAEGQKHILEQHFPK